MARVKIPSAIATVFVSLIAVFLYSRGAALSRLYLNAPSRLTAVNNIHRPEYEFFAMIRNCEDVFLDAKQGFALLSCDPSREKWNTVMGTFIDPASYASTGIYFWDYSGSNSRPEQIKLLHFGRRSIEFHPLGIEYHAASNTLFVVNHAPSGSAIELFKLLPSDRAAVHVKTLEHPKIATPNSIAILSPTEILVTNDHYFRRRSWPLLALLETYLAFPGGSVAHLKLHPNIADGLAEASVLAQVPFANGIVHLNNSTIAVASSSMMAVYLYSIQQSAGGSAPTLKQLRKIPIPFHPDNLSVDGNGKLLIAGHPHAPTLERLAKKNRNCYSDLQADLDDCVLMGLSWVAEWSEDAGVRDLYVGKDFASSTTAVRDVERGVGMITGLYAQGIYVWRE